MTRYIVTIARGLDVDAARDALAGLGTQVAARLDRIDGRLVEARKQRVELVEVTLARLDAQWR